MSLTLHFATDSHKGMIREGNEDSGYAGPRLLAVSDGMGGQAAGEVASSEVIAVVHKLDEDIPGTDLLGALGDAVERANERLRIMVEEDPQLDTMGCTLTAMLFSGQRAGLVHIGDSRAYLLRDGVLTQITTDHKWVQRLVEEGRISPEEAATHPQRSLLMRALDGKGQAEPDLVLREFRAGDRYLLCSDGLSDVVSQETLQETLSGYEPPHETVENLIQLALRAGGPDNITVIVADVLETDASDTFSGQLNDRPQIVGAVADGPQTTLGGTALSTPAARAADLGRRAPGPDDTMVGGFGPSPYGAPAGEPQAPTGVGLPLTGSDQVAGYDLAADYSKKRRRPWLRRSLWAALAVVVVGGACYGGWRWTQTQYYVGTESDHVAIYRGLDQKLLGLNLHSVEQPYPNAKLSDLPVYNQKAVKDTIGVDSLSQARSKAAELDHTAKVCRTVRTAEKQKQRQEQEKKKSDSKNSATASGSNRISGRSTGAGAAKKPSGKPTPSTSPSPGSSLSPSDAALAKDCLTDNQP